MLIDTPGDLVNEYLKWLKRGLKAVKVGDATELTTPFLDRHNDHLQLYAIHQNGEILLTDDGYILDDLEASGFNMTPARKAIVRATLSGFGVREEDEKLIVYATERTLGQKTHTLVQAMLAVNDLFVMSSAHVETVFLEDVRGFLDEREVRYSSRIKIPGQSGFDHAVDFLIPTSARRPERIVKAINAPSKSTVEAFLFLASDTRSFRTWPATYCAVLNDDKPIGRSLLAACEAYQVEALPWSEKSRLASALVD